MPLGRPQRSHDRLRHNCKSSTGSDASDHRLLPCNSIDDGPAGSRRARAGTAFAIGRRDRKCPALDPEQQFEAPPVRLCSNPDSGLWGGASVRVFAGEHRQLARRRMTNEKNVACGVIRHQRLQPLMMRLLVNELWRCAPRIPPSQGRGRAGGRAGASRPRPGVPSRHTLRYTTRVIETGVRDRVPGRRAAARRSRFKRLSKGSPEPECSELFEGKRTPPRYFAHRSGGVIRCRHATLLPARLFQTLCRPDYAVPCLSGSGTGPMFGRLSDRAG